MSFPFSSFVKLVTAAATPEQLVPEGMLVTSFIIRALSSNTGLVYLGDSLTESVTPVGAELTADTPYAQSASKGKMDLHKIWVAVTVGGEGVSVAYTTE